MYFKYNLLIINLILFFSCKNNEYKYIENGCFPIIYNSDPCYIFLPGGYNIKSPDKGENWAFFFKSNPLYDKFDCNKNLRNDAFQINSGHKISFAVIDSFIYWKCDNFNYLNEKYNLHISLNYYTDNLESFLSKSDFSKMIKQRHKEDVKFSCQLRSLQDSVCLFNKNYRKTNLK